MSAEQAEGLIHYRHYFHPAGHGTFFSGHIRCRADSLADDFVWVYDCGSKSWACLDHLVARFSARLAPNDFIDMVCLSHFDDDHVHGVESLLSKARVGVLVLPYLSLQARLALACQLSGSESSAHRLAAMIVDPSRYLAERGLRDRVERIIMVQGGPPPDPDNPSSPDDEPNSPIDQRGAESCGSAIRVSTRPIGADEVGHMHQSWIEIARHDQPWSLGGLYEFVFYNHALPNDDAPHSGASLSVVATEISDVITRHGLFTTAAPVQGWVQALRRLYDRHFGSSSRNRNDISLCALGRPVVKGAVKPCRKFWRTFPYQCFNIPCIDENPQAAVLLTGDITLNSSELSALKRHVGAARWNAVGVMQVPHHGSARSWKPGLSAACFHHHSVICAAPSVHHPNVAVMSDLRRRAPVVASYGRACAFDYHIHPAP